MQILTNLHFSRFTLAENNPILFNLSSSSNLSGLLKIFIGIIETNFVEFGLIVTFKFVLGEQSKKTYFPLTCPLRGGGKSYKKICFCCVGKTNLTISEISALKRLVLWYEEKRALADMYVKNEAFLDGTLKRTDLKAHSFFKHVPNPIFAKKLIFVNLSIINLGGGVGIRLDLNTFFTSPD